MYLAHRWRDRNLSRLELVVVLLIFALFVFFILQRAVNAFATAEKNYLDYTVSNINTALRLQTLVYLSRNQMDGLNELLETNPMRLMENQETEELKEFYYTHPGAGAAIKQLYAVQPPNYVGKLADPDLFELDKGDWYFDLQARKLVYIVINTELFFTRQAGRKRIIFSVVLDYDDINGNGSYESQVDTFNRLYLRPETDYEWLI